MSFDSKLQVFQKMDKMSAELQKVRRSEEQLRAERRLIFEKLRDANLRPSTEQDGSDASLALIVREVTALLSADGQPSESKDVSVEAAEEPEVADPQSKGRSRSSGEGESAAGLPQEDPQSQQEPETAVLEGARHTSPLREKAVKVWAQDEKTCAICDDKFHLLNRRHHCRSCGLCVCQACSPYRLNLAMPLLHPLKGNQAPHRVCKKCHIAVHCARMDPDLDTVSAGLLNRPSRPP